MARGLPGPLMHVAGRLLLYEQTPNTIIAISIGSALELLLTALAGLSVSILTLSPERFGGGFSPLWIILIAATGLVVLLHPRFISTLFQRIGVKKGRNLELKLDYRQATCWLLLYIIDWVLGGMTFFAFAAALSPVPLRQLPYIIGAWSLSGLASVIAAFLPISLGIRELTLSILLAEVLPPGVAAIIAILSRVFLTLYVLIWAFAAYLLSLKKPSLG